jgi:hypothetical protein
MRSQGANRPTGAAGGGTRSEDFSINEENQFLQFRRARAGAAADEEDAGIETSSMDDIVMSVADTNLVGVNRKRSKDVDEGKDDKFEL